MGSRRYFDDVADQWDELRSEFFADSVREAAVDAVEVEAGALAADLGAGSGFVTEELLARGLRVLAVDQSPAMLNRMQEKFGNDGRVSYLLGEAERLPIPDATVAYVFANMYLHHVASPVAAIKEMARILRLGGRVVITDLEAHDFEFLRREHHDRWLGFERHDIERWFSDARLTDIRIRPIGSSCSAISATGASRASIEIFLATAVSAHSGKGWFRRLLNICGPGRVDHAGSCTTGSRGGNHALCPGSATQTAVRSQLAAAGSAEPLRWPGRSAPRSPATSISNEATSEAATWLVPEPMPVA